MYQELICFFLSAITASRCGEIRPPYTLPYPTLPSGEKTWAWASETLARLAPSLPGHHVSPSRACHVSVPHAHNRESGVEQRARHEGLTDTLMRYGSHIVRPVCLGPAGRAADWLQMCGNWHCLQKYGMYVPCVRNYHTKAHTAGTLAGFDECRGPVNAIVVLRPYGKWWQWK